MITPIKKFICVLKGHPSKREQLRKPSSYFPNQEYVENTCDTCNTVLPCHEIKKTTIIEDMLHKVGEHNDMLKVATAHINAPKDEQPHTPTPWRIGTHKSTIVADSREGITHADYSEVSYYGGNLIAESISHVNAERIICCVNACEGISNKELATNPPLKMIESVVSSAWNEKTKTINNLLAANEKLANLVNMISDELNSAWDLQPELMNELIGDEVLVKIEQAIKEIIPLQNNQ